MVGVFVSVGWELAADVVAVIVTSVVSSVTSGVTSRSGVEGDGLVQDVITRASKIMIM